MKPTQPINTDRLPPHAPEAEAAVLGCILREPTESLLALQEAAVLVEWFYDLRHQLILHSLLRLFETLPPETSIDIIILTQRLQETGELEKAGGVAYVNTLPDLVPSAVNLEYYLDIVREKFTLRRLLATCTSLSGQVYENAGTVGEFIGQAQAEITELAQASLPRTAQKLKALLPAVVDDIEDYHRGHAQIRGLPTGLAYVDKVLCGIGQKNGNMIIISARPNMGKTSFALDVANHVALDAVWFEPQFEPDGSRKKDAEGNAISTRHKTAPVGFFSLEMKAEALADRLVWQRARADKQRWRTGFATTADLEPLAKAAIELAKAEIYIDDTPRCSIEELCAKARRMHRQHGIRLFIIDYFQLLHSQRNYRNDRVQELAHCSSMIFAVSKLLNVPFIVLAQMNRDYEKEPNRKPRLSDLKDCGAIEQDADVVGFLYRPKESHLKDDEELLDNIYGEDWSKRPERINLTIEKNRYGLTKDCELLFHKSCTHFEDWDAFKKSKGVKAPAKGETRRSLDLPSNAELGVEP